MKYELFDIEAQLKKWQQTEYELDEWLRANTIDHPDFEAKLRDFNNARIKIDQLKRRKEGFKGEVPQIYHIPQQSPINKL